MNDPLILPETIIVPGKCYWGEERDLKSRYLTPKQLSISSTRVTLRYNFIHLQLLIKICPISRSCFKLIASLLISQSEQLCNVYSSVVRKQATGKIRLLAADSDFIGLLSQSAGNNRPLSFRFQNHKNSLGYNGTRIRTMIY